MSWLKLKGEDREQIAKQQAGVLGWAVHTAAKLYCANARSDGFVPISKATMLIDLSGLWVEQGNDHGEASWSRGGELVEPNVRRIIERLVRIGLWRPVEGGFDIPEYLEDNPTAAMAQEREDRMRAQRRLAGQRSAAARKARFGTAQPVKPGQRRPSAGEVVDRTLGSVPRHVTPEGMEATLRAGPRTARSETVPPPPPGTVSRTARSGAVPPPPPGTVSRTARSVGRAPDPPDSPNEPFGDRSKPRSVGNVETLPGLNLAAGADSRTGTAHPFGGSFEESSRTGEGGERIPAPNGPRTARSSAVRTGDQRAPEPVPVPVDIRTGVSYEPPVSADDRTNRSEAAQRVWDAWCWSLKQLGRKPGQYRYDTRADMIRTRLRQYPPEELEDAARGWLYDPHYCGHNETRNAYGTNLGTVLDVSRKRNNVERFRDLWREGQEQGRPFAVEAPTTLATRPPLSAGRGAQQRDEYRRMIERGRQASGG